jgi:hypothetical protein
MGFDNWAKARSICIAASMLILGASWGFAFAQEKGGPTPSPQPSPSPPPTFQSPLTGENTGPREAQDFDNLVSLYDKYLAAGDALGNAKKCGTEEDVEAASKSYGDASNAYASAMNQYVRGYSANVYPPGPPFRRSGMNPLAITKKFNAEVDKVASAVSKASKYKPAQTNGCPNVPVTSPAPKPQPNPSHEKSQSLLGDILGHVSIGIGVGGGGNHGDHRESGPSDKPPASDSPPPPQD